MQFFLRNRRLILIWSIHQPIALNNTRNIINTSEVVVGNPKDNRTKLLFLSATAFDFLSILKVLQSRFIQITVQVQTKQYSSRLTFRCQMVLLLLLLNYKWCMLHLTT
jgi:hypothetical protein